MEFIDGIELSNMIVQKKLDERRLLYIFKKLIKIIAKLHYGGIAHCDIKLENIMIKENGDIMLQEVWCMIGKRLKMISSRTGLKFRNFLTVDLNPKLQQLGTN